MSIRFKMNKSRIVKGRIMKNFKNKSKLLTIFFAVLFLSPSLLNAESIQKQKYTTAELRSEYTTVTPGQTFYLAVSLTPIKHWHTYWKNPGDSGLAPTFDWDVDDEAATVSKDVLWPKPIRFDVGPLINYGYSDKATTFHAVSIDPDVNVGETIEIELDLNWLVCEEACVPESTELSLELSVAAVAVKSKDNAALIEALKKISPQSDAEIIAELNNAKQDTQVQHHILGVTIALLFAFLGGLLLNIMPCVFPVLSLKVLSIVQKAGKDNRIIIINGLMYCAGAIISLLLLFGIVLLLKSSGHAVGWGSQLQSPILVSLLVMIMVMIGMYLLNLLPLPQFFYNVTNKAADIENQTNRGNASFASFLTGVLAVVVATPCTAPFMAPAIGVAFIQPPLIGFLIFLSLGLGFTAPFLLLTAFPTLIKKLPKPGKWMEIMKELTAFPMFLTALWLLWVLSIQTGINGVLQTLLGVLGILFLAWLLKVKTAWRNVIWALVLAIVIVTLLSMKPARPTFNLSHNTYSLSDLATLSEDGDVFVDVTAAWCITCQLNKIQVLQTQAVETFFRENNITVIEADWTNYDADITTYLESFDRQGVPLYVVYRKGQDPVLLPQILTKEIVKNAFQ